MLAIAVRLRRVTDRPSTYTGSEACRACHAGVVDAWQSSLHHLAMLPAARRGGPVVARDEGLVMTGAALGTSEDVPLTYVLGRRHVEQYVGPLTPGRLQALPLAFDPVRGEWFDLFAGEGRRPEDFGHWTNRGMNADAQCTFCHTTGYEKGYQPDADTYRSRWVEMGVGCHAPTYAEPGHTHHAAGGSGAACVGCHMPVTTYMRRDPRHDHSFPRPDPDATVALDIPNACASCHADKNARWAAEQVQAWFPDSAERERRRETARQIQQARHGDP